MKRKKYSPKLKSKVTLVAIKGQKNTHEIGSEFGVHPSQVDRLVLTKGSISIRDLFNELTNISEKTSAVSVALILSARIETCYLLWGDHGFMITGLTNKMLREQLRETSFGRERTKKQLSEKVSCHLRLLRFHGIIKNFPTRTDLS